MGRQAEDLQGEESKPAPRGLWVTRATTRGSVSGKEETWTEGTELSQTGTGDLSQNLENPLGFTHVGNSPRPNFSKSFQNHWCSSDQGPPPLHCTRHPHPYRHNPGGGARHSREKRAHPGQLSGARAPA